ncbi:MAG: PAS domain-containing protein [Anaerolineae bacterium]|nr:PAS domain-containing protein [Anaerolineae bacterium]
MLTHKPPPVYIIILSYIVGLGFLSWLIIHKGINDTFLLLFLIPNIISAYYYKRGVFLSLHLLSGMVSLGITYTIAADFREPLSTTLSALIASYIIAEFIHNIACAHRQVENALRDTKNLFQSLIDSLPQNIFSKDLEGRFTFANKSYCITEGRTLSEILGKNDFDLHPPELARKYRQDDVGIMQKGETFETVEEHLPLGGTPRYVRTVKAPVYNVKGEIDGILGIFWDVTEEKLAEVALQEHSERLESLVAQRTTELQAQYARLNAILRSTADGIIVTDNEGKIIQANPVAQGWLTHQLSPEDADILRMATQEIAQKLYQVQGTSEETILLELTGIDIELRGASLAAAITPAEVAALQPPDDILSGKDNNGTPAAVIAAHNVSHLKAMTRMQASFVSNVSHELRTPVTTIKLYVDLLQKRPDRSQHYLAALAQAADQQTRLVADILNLSRIDAGHLQLKRSTVDVSHLIQQCVAEMTLTIARERQMAINYYPAPRPLIASIDIQRIAQAVNHMITNSVQYTLPGGKITVSTGKAWKNDRQWANVQVTDTGIGIPEHELPYIFERFRRGEQAQEMRASGTGLGLAIVKEIVELHGGRVEVTSELGQGSTFTLWIPLQK